MKYYAVQNPLDPTALDVVLTDDSGIELLRKTLSFDTANQPNAIPQTGSDLEAGYLATLAESALEVSAQAAEPGTITSLINKYSTPQPLPSKPSPAQVV